MLVLNGVDVAIAGSPILHDVSFALREGAATVLVGRNGAGKTTLLRTIMGLLRPSAGTLRVGPDALTERPGYDRAALGLGYAPEDRRLIAGFTIAQNLEIPLLALGRSKAERTEALERVYGLLPQLRELSARPAGSVSGGQGKMVALGRALMTSERVLVLDEPFQGLAPALAREYARTLTRLKSERPQLTFLVTESSPELLDMFADDALTIERGRVSPGEL